MRARIAWIKRRLVGKGMTLAVAESMTGGALSDMIISVPGASQFFKGGMVSYSPELKEMLGVNAKAIKRYGNYSRQVSEGLAKGAVRMFRSDLAIGISGLAHPDRSHRAPGAWVTVAMGKKLVSRHVTCRPGVRRNDARRRVAREALELLIAHLKDLG